MSRNGAMSFSTLDALIDESSTSPPVDRSHILSPFLRKTVVADFPAPRHSAREAPEAPVSRVKVPRFVEPFVTVHFDSVLLPATDAAIKTARKTLRMGSSFDLVDADCSLFTFDFDF